MRALGRLVFLALLLPAFVCGQEPHKSQGAGIPSSRPLEARVSRFDISDAVLRDGLSELSSKNIEDLHLGFEETIRERIQDDPKVQSPHFSLHLQGKTVREVLDSLCNSDPRYAWSEDGATINVYPRATADDPSYLLNLWIDKLAVSDVPDPDQALTPLSKRFPQQQIGYFGPGLGENTYAEPWTAAFERLTVRQFISRIAEHMGPRTSWVWEGGKNERMFTFLKGAFHTSQPSLSQ